MSPRSVTTGRRHRSLAALVTVLALTLAACSGEDPAPVPEDPGQAVVQAFESRFEDGTTVTMTVELSDRARESLLEDVEADERDVAERFYDAVTAGDLLTLSLGDEQGGFAVNLGEEQPLQLRALGDALYFLVDVPFLLEFFDAPVTVEDIRPVADQVSLALGNLAPLVDAALEGRWAGVVEIPEDAGERLNDIFSEMSEDLGAPVPDEEEVEQLRSQHSLDSFGAFVDEYVDVEEQDEGVYLATVHLRDLFRAFSEMGREVSPPGAPTIPEEEFQAELENIPESLSGFVIEVEDGRVTQVRADVYDVLVSALEDPEELEGEVQEGDAVLAFQFSDLDDALLQAPEEAETVTFDAVAALVERFARVMGGAQNLGQLDQGPGGPGGDRPRGGELPTELRSPAGAGAS